MNFRRLPRFVYRMLKLPPQFAYAVGLGPLIGRLVLLLTTTGRKSGKRRVTPLQYEWKEGRVYIGAARGQEADWFRNVLANPRVEVRVAAQRFPGLAEAITDPVSIADFLELRLHNHPRMVGSMMKAEGLSSSPSRAELEAAASHLALVVITPLS